MQLSAPGPGGPPPPPAGRVRDRLRAAACLLLAAGVPAGTARAAEPTLRIETTGLFYSERERTTVVEPIARITRLFADGQSLSAQFALDMMTGASPTGANPSGVAQTTTSASGTTTTSAADKVPTAIFKDTRGALDLSYVRPLGVLTATLGTHFSREKDYQSLGASGKLSLDLDHRLTTLTFGGGSNRDRIFPVSSTGEGGGEGGGGDDVSASSVAGVAGLTSVPSVPVNGSKRVTTGLAGVSRVLSRRWLAGVTVSRTSERGDLTEPYKVISLLDPTTGFTTGLLGEQRPSHRERMSVLTNTVYHLTNDVVHLSYRFYSDDWDIRSHTIDLRYRIEKPEASWLEPHVRLYSQSAASFFHQGLIDGRPLPEFASADQRLGRLKTVTVGATYGFHLMGQPGEWTVRAEYLGQFGDGHPSDAVGVQRNFDLAPPMHVGSLILGWSLER